jgi:hypothetical protein
LLATHLLRTAHGLTGPAVLFGTVYLLAHGLVKVILVTALLKNQLWAYPWTIASSRSPAGSSATPFAQVDASTALQSVPRRQVPLLPAGRAPFVVTLRRAGQPGCLIGRTVPVQSWAEARRHER